MYLFANFKKYSRLMASNKNQIVNICEIHLCYGNLKFVYSQILRLPNFITYIQKSVLNIQIEIYF